MLAGAAHHLTHRCHDRAFLLWMEAVGVGGVAFVGGLEAALAAQDRRWTMDREQEQGNR